VFARAEGIWQGNDEVYFNCTSGGLAQRGQVFRYRPSPQEGTAGEEANPGTLELYLEPNNALLLESIDNLTITPWGDLLLCEDSAAPPNAVTNFGNFNYLRGVTSLPRRLGACWRVLLARRVDHVCQHSSLGADARSQRPVGDRTPGVVIDRESHDQSRTLPRFHPHNRHVDTPVRRWLRAAGDSTPPIEPSECHAAAGGSRRARAGDHQHYR
jgi:hypothetical protein